MCIRDAVLGIFACMYGRSMGQTEVEKMNTQTESRLMRVSVRETEIDRKRVEKKRGFGICTFQCIWHLVLKSTQNKVSVRLWTMVIHRIKSTCRV